VNRLSRPFVYLVTAVAVLSAAPSAAADDSRDLARAQRIRSEITARYAEAHGPNLAVTESSATGVVESFALLSADLMEERVVPADNGIYYAICPRTANCPYPARRFARPAADLLPRRLALELALRTFLETSATVVAVSLPTHLRFILFIVERGDLAREVDMPSLETALSGHPVRAPAGWVQRVVDQITRPRAFVGVGLVPTPNGRDSWMGVARWARYGGVAETLPERSGDEQSAGAIVQEMPPHKE